MNVCKKKSLFRRLSSNDIEINSANKSTGGNKWINCHHSQSCECQKGFACPLPSSVKKCTSFPKLGMARSNAICSPELSSVNASNTHLSCLSYADSVSPQVSMDNLTVDDKSESNNSNHKFANVGPKNSQGGKCLTDNSESVSATALIQYPKHLPFLSPNPHHKMSPLISPRLVSRSTSCPSMTNGCKRIRSTSVTSSVSTKPKAPAASTPITISSAKNCDKTLTKFHCNCHQLKSSSITENVLENEDCSNEDVAPNHNSNKGLHNKSECTDLGKKNTKESKSVKGAIEKLASPDVKRDFEHRPMHTRRLHAHSNRSERDQWRPSGKSRSKTPDSASRNKKIVFTQGYVNIGDIPTYLAEKVMSEREPYKPENNETSNQVTRKCLQWLNSIESEEGTV